MAQEVKNLPAIQELQEIEFPFLGQEDPLEEEMATQLQYSCLENPMNRGACGLQVMGLQSVRHN